MKTMLIFLLLIISFQVVVVSQDFNSMSHSVHDLLNMNYIRMIKSPIEKAKYTGSPYEKDEFILGSLYMVTNQTYTGVPLRLNIFNNEIEFKTNDDKIYALDNPELVDYITIGESKIKYLPYSVLKKVSKGYFKVLEEGEAMLLSKPKVAFVEETPPAPYKEAIPASFNRRKDEIFIKVDEREAQLVTNKKSLVEILSKKQNQVEKFIKENKIKLSDTADIRKVVKFYNFN